MIKDKHDLNQEKLLEIKEKLLQDNDHIETSDDRSSKANTKYDPKQFNVEAYSYGDYESGDMVFDNEEDEIKSKNFNHEGLRYPSIDDLLEVVDSKYKLAYIAAKRAKIIKNDNYSSVNNKCVKAVGMALEEILAKKVTAKF
ncbi:MAG: DNA-directed RNA polymerase subunit omega [Candidatus Izemoplasmatales bacterium]|jgi:DNA-directed RNA polymerase subunit omega|nr:DNA-directed RNA polymerase subunit omega [Candidatus Izemoplasmatales bacterium]